MTDLIDAQEIITIKQYLHSVHNGTLHNILRYILQLERERDAAVIRAARLRKQLDEVESEQTKTS